MIAAIGRIQWSKLGITVYDGDGSFVSRIEHIEDRTLFNAFVIEGLKQVNLHQLERRKFKSQQIEEQSDAIQKSQSDEGSIRGLPRQEDAAGRSSVGSGDAKHQAVAGEGEAEQKEEVNGAA